MYYSITLVLNSRVFLMYTITDTVKELPGYPLQNCPSGRKDPFLRGACWQGGNSIWYCVKGIPQKDTLDDVAYTCMLSYPVVVSHLSFNFLCLLLLYNIYLSAQVRPTCSKYVNNRSHRHNLRSTAGQAEPILRSISLKIRPQTEVKGPQAKHIYFKGIKIPPKVFLWDTFQLGKS